MKTADTPTSCTEASSAEHRRNWPNGLRRARPARRSLVASFVQQAKLLQAVHDSLSTRFSLPSLLFETDVDFAKAVYLDVLTGRTGNLYLPRLLASVSGNECFVVSFLMFYGYFVRNGTLVHVPDANVAACGRNG